MTCILAFNPCNSPKKVGETNTVLILQLKNVRLWGHSCGLLKITSQERSEPALKHKRPPPGPLSSPMILKQKSHFFHLETEIAYLFIFKMVAIIQFETQNF